MAVKDDIKTLVGISDGSKDLILDIYIRKATTLVKNYLNKDDLTPETIEADYPDAVIDIVVTAYNMRNKENIKQIQQGARTVVYSDNTVFAITDSVANLLPAPYARMC
ncbi:MAG: phage head-tail connector protein [Solirubrobacterales bacterium]